LVPALSPPSAETLQKGLQAQRERSSESFTSSLLFLYSLLLGKQNSESWKLSNVFMCHKSCWFQFQKIHQKLAITFSFEDTTNNSRFSAFICKILHWTGLTSLSRQFKTKTFQYFYIQGFFLFCFFVVLGLELRAYTLSHSTIPFLWWVFLR
jgi:hypothetical protein